MNAEHTYAEKVYKIEYLHFKLASVLSTDYIYAAERLCFRELHQSPL